MIDCGKKNAGPELTEKEAKFLAIIRDMKLLYNTGTDRKTGDSFAKRIRLDVCGRAFFVCSKV